MASDAKDTQFALFRGKQIRKAHNDECWFVAQDVVAALTDSADPRQYLKQLRAHDPESGNGWVQRVPTLAIQTAGESNSWDTPTQLAKGARRRVERGRHSRRELATP